MSAPAGMIGDGSTLQYGDVGSTPSTEITGLMSVEFPEMSAADVKDLNYKTDNNVIGYIPGHVEGGVVNCEVDYAKAGCATVHSLFRTPKAWKVTAPDGGNETFNGYINKIGTPLPNEDKVVVKFTIKVTSLPTFSTT